MRFLKSPVPVFVKKHWRAIALWTLGVFLVFGGFSLLWASNLQIPDLASLENRVIEQSVSIYDRTGDVLLYDLNNGSRRTVVPLSAISPFIQQATIAVEDPTFYKNAGVVPSAILRAVIIDILQGARVQGGSTITQQVVKMTILTSDKSIARKLKEWVLALKLTRTISKDDILAIYLNQTPYGGTVYGVEQASQTFFGKHASEVGLAEAAYLAAVLPAPTYYSPYGNNKDALDSKKNLVLAKMHEHGYITKGELDQAKKEVVVFVPRKTSSITAPHFVFFVEQYLEDKYGPEALRQGGWKVITTLNADFQTHAQEIVEKHALSNEKNFTASNAGLVALDPQNGQILAMVGSRNYFDEAIDGNFNITLASRQPGSTFKPFAYAQAFREGYTPDTVVFDLQTQFSSTCAADNFTSDDGCYSPDNYDNLFRGPISLRNAIAQSINIPSVKVLYLAGITDTLTLAKSMGITTLTNANQYGLTLVLGGGEVTPLELTSAYGTFASNGTHYPYVSVLKITDQNGNTVEDNTQPEGAVVLEPAVAEQINDILSDPVARAPLGMNSLLSFPGHDVAVKTGTTNNYRDAWTVGYTPNIVVGIWAGNNDNTPMVKKVSGYIVGPMWNEFMSYALSKLPNTPFTRRDAQFASTTKPVLLGNWAVPGNDGTIHEILYWVSKSNPNGPIPTNPNDDPQFRLWDPPVQRWLAQHPEYLPAIAPPLFAPFPAI